MLSSRRPSTRIKESTRPYEIESELGTLSITTHQVTTLTGRLINDIGNGYFEPVRALERYRTSRFNELLLDYATDNSYRKMEKRLNRIRQQNNGIKTTTIRNIVEREGEAINRQMQRQAQEALKENGFSTDGIKKEGTPNQDQEFVQMDEAKVMSVGASLGVTIDFSDYENPEQTVDISIDDVGVKRQSATRPNTAEKGGRKYAYQTVVQINHQGKGYTLNAKNHQDALIMLMGFLLSNGLLWTKRLVFYIDGELALRQAIENSFGFLPIKIILDWYHVDKKLKERLSMGMAGYKLRNAFLEQIRPLLWKGDIPASIALLETLPDNQVKSYEHITKLIEYLKRNRPYIPCYALRAGLGLCNSSNKGEKANDLAVANRQKHNGMSWSIEGSLALASICVAARNDELTNWVASHKLNFSLLNDAV